jgi:hypothetical protein
MSRREFRSPADAEIDPESCELRGGPPGSLELSSELLRGGVFDALARDLVRSERGDRTDSAIGRARSGGRVGVLGGADSDRELSSSLARVVRDDGGRADRGTLDRFLRVPHGLADGFPNQSQARRMPAHAVTQ